MSIIYDALTKVQRSKKFSAKRKSWFDRLLILTILILSFMLIGLYTSNKIERKAASAKASAKKPTLTQSSNVNTAPAPKLTQIDYSGQVILNGIFISDSDKFAIINNKTVHIGDNIGDKKITAINYSHIILQDNTHWYVINNKANS